MNKDRLLGLIGNRLSIREIADAENTSATNVRYWLKKYGLKTINGPFGYDANGRRISTRKAKCCGCGETDQSKFYGRKKDMCAKCHNKYNIDFGRARRLEIIRLMGGRCRCCGFDKWPSALQLHHLNPDTKSINFGSYRGWGMKRLIAESMKCILLCSNCHAGVHSGDLVLKIEK